MVTKQKLSFDAQVAGFETVQRAATRLAEALNASARPPLPLFQSGMFTDTPVEEFVAAFELSAFERDLLLFLAGININHALSEVIGVSRGGYVDFGSGLALLTEEAYLEQAAIAPTGRLRRWNLMQFGDDRPSQPLNLRPLLIDEWAFLAMMGIVELDGRLLTAVAALHPSNAHLSEAQRRVVDRIAAVASESAPVLQIAGAETELRFQLAASAAGSLQRPLYALDIARLEVSAVDDFAVRWNRFARLKRALLLVDIGDFSVGETSAEDPKLRAARGFVAQLEGAVFVTTRLALNWGRETVSFEVKRPTGQEQRELWRARFPPKLLKNADIEGLTGQFDLTGSQIERVASDALGRGEKDLGSALWNSSLALLRPRLEGLTQRIEPAERADWSRLILPESDLNMLKRLVAHVKQRQKVYETWGWQGDSTRGFGISALFGGPSGTGKTFSAEIIARELGVDLQRIELPSIVSKYIGESEKLLSKLFDAAEYGGCILLFDEADAIFGKRSEVKDSNDRYANLEVSYLLQRMEAFRGLVILTTNQESNMDSAFMRRLRFVVHYPNPDAAARSKLWQGIFPINTPTQGLRFERLAQLEVSGGNIRNIALNAAFNASSEGSPVRMRHLHESALEEVRKLKRLPRGGEFDGWAD